MPRQPRCSVPAGSAVCCGAAAPPETACCSPSSSGPACDKFDVLPRRHMAARRIKTSITTFEKGKGMEVHWGGGGVQQLALRLGVSDGGRCWTWTACGMRVLCHSSVSGSLGRPPPRTGPSAGILVSSFTVSVVMAAGGMRVRCHSSVSSRAPSAPAGPASESARGEGTLGKVTPTGRRRTRDPSLDPGLGAGIRPR